MEEENIPDTHKVVHDVKYVLVYPVYPEICLFSQTSHDVVFVCREMPDHKWHGMEGITLCALAQNFEGG